jgi:hypothetical protein
MYLNYTKIEAKINNVWTDISAYVVTDLKGEGGIYSNAYDNRLASTGTLSFSMNNASGDFTPSDTFKKGTEIRVTINYVGNSKVKFYGRISNIRVDTGTWGNQRVHIEALDWFDVAQNQMSISRYSYSTRECRLRRGR